MKQNFYSATFGSKSSKLPSKLKTWLTNQHIWTHQQIANNPDDTGWQAAGLIQRQLEGLVAEFRYSSASTAPLELEAFLLLSAAGDSDDLLKILEPDQHNLSAELSAIGSGTRFDLAKIKLLGRHAWSQSRTRSRENC